MKVYHNDKKMDNTLNCGNFEPIKCWFCHLRHSLEPRVMQKKKKKKSSGRDCHKNFYGIIFWTDIGLFNWDYICQRLGKCKTSCEVHPFALHFIGHWSSNNNCFNCFDFFIPPSYWEVVFYSFKYELFRLWNWSSYD